jgi:hypothetical protein
LKLEPGDFVFVTNSGVGAIKDSLLLLSF